MGWGGSVEVHGGGGVRRGCGSPPHRLIRGRAQVYGWSQRYQVATNCTLRP